MRNLLLSLFAVGVAAVAAMTATTAMLNAPRRSVPAVITQNVQPADTAPPPEQSRPPAGEHAPPASPDGPADAGAKPASSASGGADKKDTAGGEPEGDKDPYAGVAPEELPPDLQYSADSSVSFPTNI